MHVARRVKVANDFLNTTKSSENDSNNHLKMPTKINLHTSGLRRSSRLKESHNAKTKAHVQYGTRANKAILGLLTIISLVSKVSMPSHQRKSNETYSERFVRRFEEWNEHFDSTVNQMHMFSLLTDVKPSNETRSYT